MDMRFRFLQLSMLRKIIPYAIGAILFALVVYGFYSYIHLKENPKKDKKNSGFILVNDESNGIIDSDGDGVPDWEEALWTELDPHNPDSDGDGVSDYDYIRQKKRDYESNINAASGFSYGISESDRVGRGLYTALSTMLESGDISEQDREVVANNVADYIADINLADRTFISTDFNIVDNSKEYSLEYKQKLTELTTKYPIRLDEFELVVVAASDPDAYAVKVYHAAVKYQEYLNELLRMNVPSAISKQHVELTNIIAQIAGSLQNISKENEDVDDLVVLSSLVQIEEIFNQTVDTLHDLSIYFGILEDESSFNDQS